MYLCMSTKLERLQKVAHTVRADNANVQTNHGLYKHDPSSSARQVVKEYNNVLPTSLLTGQQSDG